jgi:hypothetical protein
MGTITQDFFSQDMGAPPLSFIVAESERFDYTINCLKLKVTAFETGFKG